MPLASPDVVGGEFDRHIMAPDRGVSMKVLLAIDRSPFSEAAVAEVAERPWSPGTVIQVMTVVHAPTPMALDPAFVMAAIHVEQLEEQRRLAAVLVSAAADQIKRGRSHVGVITR